MKRVMTHIRSILEILEPNSYDREGLEDTPERVSRLYEEMFCGYNEDAAFILSAQFENEAYDEENRLSSGMVIVQDIEFFSHCEHHMVPFFGSCSIGYIPGKKVVGISKLGRLVHCYAKRLQIQERMTKQIADAIQYYLEPEGVMVVVNATHLCMKMRGLRNATASTTTSAIRGAFEKAEVRQEFLSLIRK